MVNLIYSYGLRGIINMKECNLPEKIYIKDVNNNSIEKAQQIYLKELGNNDELFFKGLPVKVTRTLDYNLRQQTFEHIISRDMKARLYDLNRMDKIPWIKHMLCCCEKSNCKNYSFINDRGKEYCIWCKKENYLIILELRIDPKTKRPFYYLKTAYPIIYKDKLKQMYKKEQNENGKN